jgi:hypothetical protein
MFMYARTNIYRVNTPFILATEFADGWEFDCKSDNVLWLIGWAVYHSITAKVFHREVIFDADGVVVWTNANDITLDSGS